MIARIPDVVTRLFSGLLWKMPAEGKNLYLTFDDGPIPEVTPWVLDILKEHKALGTFFCIGENVQRNPEIFQHIIAEGHSIGNHTHNHLNGWSTSSREYLLNTVRAQDTMDKHLPESRSKNVLFRPPYGKITVSQAKDLQKRGFSIVMWNVLSMDYDQKIDPEKCYQNVVKNARPGSIVIFHDSLKAQRNLKQVLPRTLEYFSQKGYSFKKLQ